MTHRRLLPRAASGAALAVAVTVVAPATTAVAAPQVTLVAGSAALATFEQVSADGCRHTFGELALVQAYVGGELADGLYVTGMQEDTCTGAGNGFAGFTEGDVPILPLLFAHHAATVVVDSYSGGAPVTLELDLTWLGRGRVSRDGGVFEDETQISFSFSRRRDARAVGSLAVDGEPATVTTATLVAEASGQIVR